MLKEVKLVSHNVLIMFSILDIGQSILIPHQKHVRSLFNLENLSFHVQIYPPFIYSFYLHSIIEKQDNYDQEIAINTIHVTPSANIHLFA